MRRLRIKHQTGFHYPAVVSASYNEARMQPMDTQRQYLLHSRIEINPLTSRDSFIDYWGTRVTAFEILEQHEELTLSAESLIEIQPREHDPGDLTWEDLDGIGDRSVELSDQLFATVHTTPTEPIVTLAEEVRARAATPALAAREICDAIADEIEYVRGATHVASTAAEVWEHKKGVCQDIAHVAVSALRSIGIPARYVSGYVQPTSSFEVGQELSGESHAWIEWYAGDWTGYDPTNSLEINDSHVIVGRGRDYADVAPLRGIYAGKPGADLFVEVSMTREI
ncbi:transglutaminase family protein [Blastococcus sp. Marseille-P5729]|uniref:transglutaminase family protein n=1 Tax=Blastococcus sp. Marseille-P5729 TaxID=2086582 RepID=UPI000D0EF477|nr:transglutaminase family protein [Blastococcus sp. Marseille-P5729]